MLAAPRDSVHSRLRTMVARSSPAPVPVASMSLGVLLLLGAGACTNVRSSGVATGRAATPNEGRVVVRASDIPNGAVEVGVAQAFGQATVDKLVPEFSERVRKLGGNFGKIDDISTKFEIKSWSESYTYNCGTYNSPRQCTGHRQRSAEVATTTIVGRAFLVGGKPK